VPDNGHLFEAGGILLLGCYSSFRGACVSPDVISFFFRVTRRRLFSASGRTEGPVSPLLCYRERRSFLLLLPHAGIMPADDSTFFPFLTSNAKGVFLCARERSFVFRC